MRHLASISSVKGIKKTYNHIYIYVKQNRRHYSTIHRKISAHTGKLIALQVVLGFLTLTAVAIGTAVGLWIRHGLRSEAPLLARFGNLTMLQELHRINQGEAYLNSNI